MAIPSSTSISPRSTPKPVARPEPKAPPTLTSVQQQGRANAQAQREDTFTAAGPKATASSPLDVRASPTGKNLPPIESNKNTVQAGTVTLTDDEKKARGAQKVEPGTNGEIDHKRYDGMYVGSDGYAYPPDKFQVSEVPPFKPAKPISTPPPTTYHVNGIDTQILGDGNTFGEAQKLANKTGTNVVPIYNATEGLPDALQTAGDRLGAPGNKATDTLTNAIYNDLKAGKQVNVVGYSQGGAITAHALRQVDERIANDNGGFFGNLPVVGNDNRRKREELLGNVNVTSIAGAGKTFPAGPKYNFYVNSQDPVPTLLGTHEPTLGSALIGGIVSASPGLGLLNGGSPFQKPPGAKIHTFDTGDSISSPLGVNGTHGFNTYLSNIQDSVR